MTELYKRYRPKTFADVFGQSSVCVTLEEMVNSKRVPHAILFSGPSGCGKTTLARILKVKLRCKGTHNYQEINAANYRGIDMVRDMTDALYNAPMGGKARVAVIDEAQGLTKDAQNCILKVLEDPPPHAYIMLCTTDPQKLIKTIITRCTELKVVALDDQELTAVLQGVLTKEKINEKQVAQAVLEKIIECAEGSARKALVLLDQVIGLKNEKEQLDAVQKSDTKRQAIDLCRLVFRGASWKEIATAIKEIGDEPETVRRIMLGYASSCCLGGSKIAAKAAAVINACRDHYYDCGKAGLVLSMWDVCHE